VKIATVIGARPQFIKAAVVSRALRAHPDVEEVLIHTGQHYDDNMSAVFFDELDIRPPDHHLGVGSGPHGAQTGRMLELLEEVLVASRPDWLVVLGDTNSTLAGALAAAKLRIPVAHVEAGMRSFNRDMPEEINRILADHVSALLFAATAVAVRNLRREGFADVQIRLVGDVMYDAALHYGDRARATSRILEQLGLAPGAFVLATTHRAENTDDPARLRAIVDGLRVVAAELPVVMPIHPRTRAALVDDGLDPHAAGLHLIEPVGYLDMMVLEQHARVIATDSGGVQKEAYFYRVPCVTLRTETEWEELVETGWNRLVPPESAGTVAAGVRAAVDQRGKDVELYGGGDASEQIAAALLDGPPAILHR
jgi:UDP-GlcNAc3NAcA epimerase